MFCITCGGQINDGSTFCNFCGTAQPLGSAQTQPQQQATYQQPTYFNYQQPNYQQQSAYPNYQQPIYNQPMPPAPDMSRKDFYKQFMSKKSNGYVTSMSVICFVTAAISAVLIFSLENMLGILDVTVYVIFGALLLFTKHWLYALIPTVYSGFWTVVNFAAGGTPSGIVALIIGISCVSVLIKADKAYKNYRTNRIIPTQQL